MKTQTVRIDFYSNKVLKISLHLLLTDFETYDDISAYVDTCFHNFKKLYPQLTNCKYADKDVKKILECYNLEVNV